MGLADTARYVIGCLFTQKPGTQTAVVDVVSKMCQAIADGADGSAPHRPQGRGAPLPPRQGGHQALTLVHFLAQLKRFFGIGGARRGCLGVLRE